MTVLGSLDFPRSTVINGDIIHEREVFSEEKKLKNVEDYLKIQMFMGY
jgi:hypothetical protein